MNEEVVMKFGVDNSALHKGLRSAKELAAGFAEEMSPSKLFGGLKAAVGLGAAGLGIEKIGESVHASIELAESIKRTSTELGVSTTFLQQWTYSAEQSGSTAEAASMALEKLSVKIGEARSGSADASAEFAQWGISLTDASGNARNTEEVLGEVRRRMAELTDPAQRNAMAFQLMGKSAAQLSETMADFDQLKNKASILNETEIDVLHRAGQATKNLWNSITTGIAHVTSGLLVVGRLAVGMGLPKAPEKSSTAGSAPIEDARKHAELLAKLDKETAEATRAGMTPQQRLKADEKELLRLKTQARDMEEGSNRALENEIAQKEIIKRLAEEQREVDSEANTAKKKALTEHLAIMSAQARLQDAMAKAATAAQNLKTDKEGRSKVTLGQLASNAQQHRGGHWESGWGGRQWVSNRSQDEQTALNIQDTEARATQARLNHDPHLADDLTNQALDMRHSLEPVLKSEDTDPLKGALDQLQKSFDAVAKCASNGKLNVNIDGDDL